VADTAVEAPVGETGGELQDLADRVAGWAADGEQVEAYVGRGRHTDRKSVV